MTPSSTSHDGTGASITVDYLPELWWLIRVARMSHYIKVLRLLVKNGRRKKLTLKTLKKLVKMYYPGCNIRVGRVIKSDMFYVTDKITPSLFGMLVLAANDLKITKFGLLILSYIRLRLKYSKMCIKSSYDCGQLYSITKFMTANGNEAGFRAEYGKLVAANFIPKGEIVREFKRYDELKKYSAILDMLAKKMLEKLEKRQKKRLRK